VRRCVGGGHNAVVTARRAEELQEFTARFGAQVIARPLDVTDYRAAVAAAELAVERFGRLDVVANVAGYGNLAPIEDTSIDDFRAQIETNLLRRHSSRKSRDPDHAIQRAGHIIRSRLSAVELVRRGEQRIPQAKFGVEGFSEVMATEMAPLGVKVTIIEPGGFRTDFRWIVDDHRRRSSGLRFNGWNAARFQHSYNGKQPAIRSRLLRSF